MSGRGRGVGRGEREVVVERGGRSGGCQQGAGRGRREEKKKGGTTNDGRHGKDLTSGRVDDGVDGRVLDNVEVLGEVLVLLLNERAQGRKEGRKAAAVSSADPKGEKKQGDKPCTASSSPQQCTLASC